MHSGGLDLIRRLGSMAADRPVPAVLAALLVILLAGTVRHRAARPQPGEIWFAQVPFRDGTGSKDRPVLVLSVARRRCTVAQFTSQDQDARRDYLRVPAGIPGLSRSSWVSLRTVRLPRSAMRRRSGAPGAALVNWYVAAAAR